MPYNNMNIASTYRVLRFAALLLFPSLLFAQYEAFHNLPLNALAPEGWQRNLLLKQRNGLTGHLDETCEPFNQKGIWAGPKDHLQGINYRVTRNGKEYLSWVPFEQTGYYYDGVARCGLLLNDPFLLEKARKQIYGAIAEAPLHGGIIGGEQSSRWAQVVFFRSFMALYEATGDKVIIEAMERHYASDTSNKLAHARDIYNVEQLMWLYGQTGKRAYLERSVSLYEAEARSGDRNVNTYADLSSGKRQDVHGSTYHEALKNPILLYMATGERKYLEAVRNGYAKVEKYSMLPDGMPSTEEGLSGKTTASRHEVCAVSDYVWATLYMLKATGEVEWADRIERAVLNAALGSVTKEFDAHQYLSGLNQVHLKVGGGMSMVHSSYTQCYAQRHTPQCCSGQINRILPNYFGAQWMTGKDSALVKVFYGPGSCVHKVDGAEVKVREQSDFPFGDTITIRVTDGKATFPLLLRIPGWAKKPSVWVNGKSVEGVVVGQFLRLEGEHKAGDEVRLTFPREVRVMEFEINGVVVDYGPLLFSLPIAAKCEKKLLNRNYWFNTPLDVDTLYAYDMEAASKWNYILGLDGKNNHRIEVVHNPHADLENPWNPTNSPIEIRVMALECKDWLELQTYKKFTPFWDKQKEVLVPVTPELPARGSMIMVPRICEKPERIALVPYGSTTLRLTVFPYWDVADIPRFQVDTK